MYQLDLDACNEREQDDEEDDEDLGVDGGPVYLPNQNSDGDDYVDVEGGGLQSFSNGAASIRRDSPFKFNNRDLNRQPFSSNRNNNPEISGSYAYDKFTNTKEKQQRKNDIINKKANPYDVSNYILQYSEDKVDKQPFKQLLVRGSSQKDKINFNENLMVFFLHGNKLFYWTRMPHNDKDNLTLMRTITSKTLYPKNDSCFFFRQDLMTQENSPEQRTVVYEKIIKCDISTSTFQIETLFVESALSDTLLSYSYDKNKEKLILFLSTMSHMNKSKITYKLKVYDCKLNIIQYQTIITQPILIGRLKSGRYTFADGHIYYSNNVIKLRYDLIESVNS